MCIRDRAARGGAANASHAAIRRLPRTRTTGVGTATAATDGAEVGAASSGWGIGAAWGRAPIDDATARRVAARVRLGLLERS